MPHIPIDQIEQELESIRSQQLWKNEHPLETPQGSVVRIEGRQLINFCANNYLGLANHPAVLQAAHAALDQWGYGLASVRFISGTQKIHHELEQSISNFFQTDSTILYSSCFDANAGLFETITNEQDAIISDRLNHASLIDGVRLSKAQRHIYEHLNLSDLESKLVATAGARRRIIVTDGVFSMDGDIADLQGICDLADKYRALVIVDDSHATGFLGPTGRGTPELHGVMHRVDIVTSTLGKALGGASGGFITGRREIIQLLRQRSRPYLFSNSLAPMIAATSLAILKMLEQDSSLRQQLLKNTEYARAELAKTGLSVRPGNHPVIPIMIHDAVKTQKIAADMYARGYYVVGFFYPVVPMEQARIRVQISAAHTKSQIDGLIEAFRQVFDEYHPNTA